MSVPVSYIYANPARNRHAFASLAPAAAAARPGHSPSPDLEASQAGRCCGPGMSTSPPRPSTSSASTADFSSDHSSSSPSWPPAAAVGAQQQQHPACSACKHQRRKCAPGCVLARYFPADKPGSFRNSHRLFGIKNILQFLKMAGPEKQDDCMKSLLFEADARAADPVLGSYGVLHRLQQDLFYLQAELDAVRKRLALHGSAAQAQHCPAPDAPGFLSPVQPWMPPPVHTIPGEEQRAFYGVAYVLDGVKIDEAAKIEEDAVMSMQHDESQLHAIVGAPFDGGGPSSSSDEELELQANIVEGDATVASSRAAALPRNLIARHPCRSSSRGMFGDHCFPCSYCTAGTGTTRLGGDEHSGRGRS